MNVFIALKGTHFLFLFIIDLLFVVYPRYVMRFTHAVKLYQKDWINRNISLVKSKFERCYDVVCLRL